MASVPSKAAPVVWQRTTSVLLSVVLVVAALYWAQAVLIPVSLALLLTFLLSPLVSFFQRRGLGRAPAVVVVTVLTFSLLGAMAWGLFRQVGSLANDLPRHQGNLIAKVNDLRQAFKGGIIERVQRTVEEVSQEIDERQKEGGKKGEPVPVVVQPQQITSIPQLPAGLGNATELLASAGLVIILVIFMLIKREDLRNRLIRLVGYGRLTVTTKALDEAGARISRYLLAQLIVNATYGLALGVALFFIGVPYALLWGFLAAVLRYIPYIGAWVAAAFPVTMAFIVYPGWTQVILVVAAIVVFELISNNIMEPLMYGRSAGVSEVALLVAAAFWAWLWGPIGLILATPLTVCLVVLGKYVPQLEAMSVLLGDTPALEADLRLYQRLVAGDHDEAWEIIEEYLDAEEREPHAVFDELLLPALTFTKRDRERRRLTEDDQETVVRTLGDLVEELATLRAREAEAQAQADVTAGDDPVDSDAPVRILACPARDELDELAVTMFRQLLQPCNCVVEVLGPDALTSEVVGAVQEHGAGLVFIAALPPGGLAHARYLCKRLRLRYPELRILVGRWGLGGSEEHQDQNRRRLKEAGATDVGLTLEESRRQVVQALHVLAGTEAARPGRLQVQAS